LPYQGLHQTHLRGRTLAGLPACACPFRRTPQKITRARAPACGLFKTSRSSSQLGFGSAARQTPQRGRAVALQHYGPARRPIKRTRSGSPTQPAIRNQRSTTSAWQCVRPFTPRLGSQLSGPAWFIVSWCAPYQNIFVYDKNIMPRFGPANREEGRRGWGSGGGGNWGRWFHRPQGSIPRARALPPHEPKNFFPSNTSPFRNN
jgi:hypothetical protein